MYRAAVAVAASIVVASVLVVIHLAAAPDPFRQEPALVLATGFVLFTLIAVGGLMLSRGRWSRYLTLGLVAAFFAATVATETSGWSIASAVVGGVALAILLGPWTRGWLRLRPAADGPSPRAIALVLGAVGLVPVVAVAAPTELSTWHGVLAGGGLLLAYAYSRAQLWSLWALRFTLAPVAVPAVISSPIAGAALLAIFVAGLTILAWTREARLAVDPVYAQLPGPRVGTPKGARLGDEEPS